MHHLAPASAVARSGRSQRRQNATVASNSAAIVGCRSTAPASRRARRARARSVAVSPAESATPAADVAAVDDLDRATRRKAELQVGSAEERAVRGELDLVAGPCVVETWGDVDDEAHLPADSDDSADDAVMVRRFARSRRGHEILHLTHSVAHEEPSDEHIGVRKVELFGAPPVAVGGDAEQAAAVGVEDRREDARRVEARAAVPVDRPVGADERNRVQVADQAVLGDRQVARSAVPVGHQLTRPALLDR